MEESLAASKRKRDRFNTATVVYDAKNANYYYGMNKGIKLSGDNIHPSLASWLPDTTLEDGLIVGNCAEVDAVNQALNSGANVADLYMYTIDTKKNISKKMCENCKYTFYGRVADIFSE